MAAEGQLSPAKPDDKTTNAPVNKATTCIDVGAQYKRWTDLKNDLHCGNDTLAKLLLDIWFQFKEEDDDTKNLLNKHIQERVKPEAASERRYSITPKSGSSSFQNSRDGFDSSTCSSNEGLFLTNGTDKNKRFGEQFKGNDSSSRRRKQPKSRVSRYLEEEEEAEEATNLEDYEAWRGKWEEEVEEKGEEDDGKSPKEYVADADDSNACGKDGEEEEEEEDYDPENDFLSEEELEKILKGSESESDCKRKRKRDSDSDWMPTADDSKSRRRRSRRISKQSVRIGAGRGRRASRKKMSSSGESSEEEVVEEKPKNPRGRPRKVRKDAEEDESNSSQLSPKPKLMKRSGVFTCTICSEKFAKKEEGREHLETHYTIDCSSCTQKFFSQQTLAFHQSKKHPNLKCKQCFYTGQTRMDLKRHMRKEHLEPEAVPGTTLCHICGEQFRFVVNVQKHLIEVHGITETNMKTYMCDQCGNEYFLKHSLRKHMLTHKDKNIICEFEGCCSKFSSDAQYKRHYNTVHLKIKRHSCPYEDCDMKFAFRKTLATHVNMVHLKLRLFPCTWPGCERSFYAKKHLTVHLRIHNDEKPFKCQQCDYRCRQRAALNWHLKKHGIVPDHPESLENEKRNKKDGFPVNFKRGRKRTRFRKAKSLDYTDDQIASINRRYNDMISDVDNQIYHVFSKESSVAQEEEASPQGSDNVRQISPDGRELASKRDGPGLENLKYLERRDPPPSLSPPSLQSPLSSLPAPHPHPPPQRPTDHAQGFARRDLQSPAQETYPVDLLKREVDYPQIDYDPQKQVRMNDFHPVRETDFQTPRENEYHSVREAEFQHTRDNSMSSARDEGFQSIRDNFASSREGNYQHVRESDYHPVRTPTSEYQGYTMKENLDSDRGFPRFLSKDVFTSSSHRESNFSPRLPIKDSYMSAQPVTEIDYSRFPPKNELSALRTLPPGFQSQMDIPQEYDPRSPVHALMGGNSVGYSQDLQMYSREYK